MAKLSVFFPKFRKVFLPFVLFILSFSFVSNAQIITNSGIPLPENSVKNYRLGLLSNNEGIIMSCVYYAGKYQIKEFCDDLISLIENSDNVEISKMAVWSLYQIGDISACEKLKAYLEENPNPELINCSKFLEQIRKYDKEVIETIKLVEHNAN